MTKPHKVDSRIDRTRGAADDAVLTFRAISKRFQYGRRWIDALRDISLDVRRCRITGLIGPDGAGKTTLMRLAAGLLLPDSGQGFVLEMDIVRQARSVQATVGYMPQQFGL
jgi:ABC-2 type transport system ATP-binding protein